MASQARPDSRAEAKRELILDAAEKVMVDRGYAGVTSRSVGAAAGLPAPLVHYYFATLDDLFIALLRRGVQRSKDRFLEALASPEPLKALWELNLDRRGTSLSLELVALSNHRDTVRDALIDISIDFQEVQINGLRELFEGYSIDTTAFPPELGVLALGGIARMVVREQAMGVTIGHDVALAAIDRLIERAQTPKQAKRRRRVTK